MITLSSVLSSVGLTWRPSDSLWGPESALTSLSHGGRLTFGPTTFLSLEAAKAGSRRSKPPVGHSLTHTNGGVPAAGLSQ